MIEDRKSHLGMSFYHNLHLIQSLYQIRILASMDLEGNEMKFTLYHPSVQSIQYGKQFGKFYFSFDMDIIPLKGKINLHKKVGEMIYSVLGKGSLLIRKEEKLLENVVTKIKEEKVNSRALDL